MSEWGKWYQTDNDCCQYIRKQSDILAYEMIQSVWLDTTEEDIKNGLTPYVVVAGGCSLNGDDISKDEIDIALSPYGYTVSQLVESYGIEGAKDIIAECILEESVMNDSCVIGGFETFEEAEKYVLEYIKESASNEESQVLVLHESGW